MFEEFAETNTASFSLSTLCSICSNAHNMGVVLGFHPSTESVKTKIRRRCPHHGDFFKLPSLLPPPSLPLSLPICSQQSSGLDPNILRKCAKALDEALPTVPMDWKDYFQRNWLFFRGSKAAKFFSKHWSVDDTESTLIHFEYRSRMGPKASLMAGKTRALSEHGLMVSPKIHQLESHGQWKGNSYPNHHGEFTYPIASATGKTPEVPKRATWQSTSELLVDRWSNDSWQKPNVSKFDEWKTRAEAVGRSLDSDE